MTVTELLGKISSAEIPYWAAFFKLERQEIKKAQEQARQKAKRR